MATRVRSLVAVLVLHGLLDDRKLCEVIDFIRVGTTYGTQPKLTFSFESSTL
jgi:hypothetical protein